MSNELAKANDFVASGLIAGTQAAEGATAVGRYRVECRDAEGNIKWVIEEDNLVVNVGLQYMAGTALTSTAQITCMVRARPTARLPVTRWLRTVVGLR